MENQNKKTITIPLNGCLTMLLLGALCAIAVKECKRADIRLKTDQIKYQRLTDSLKNVRNDTATFILNNTKQLEK